MCVFFTLLVISPLQITRVTGVPTMMLDLMKHPDWSPHKVASLKNVMAGGAPVPPSQVTEMRAKSKKITSSQGYGLTETFAIGTASHCFWNCMDLVPCSLARLLNDTRYAVNLSRLCQPGCRLLEAPHFLRASDPDYCRRGNLGSSHKRKSAGRPAW